MQLNEKKGVPTILTHSLWLNLRLWLYHSSCYFRRHDCDLTREQRKLVVGLLFICDKKFHIRKIVSPARRVSFFLA